MYIILSYKDVRNTIKKPFILPEYRNKPEEFYLKMPKEKYMIEMNNLRFIVPELIFNPNLIGIEEGGLHEGVVHSINSCHKDYNNLLYKNIILSGGNTNFKGFKEKLKKEIIPFSELNSEVRSFEFEGKDKMYNVIKGMKAFAANEEMMKNCAMTKNEYDELGFNILWKQYL
jgi:actin-related protein 6